MLEDVGQDKIDVVVVHRLDRLSRSLFGEMVCSRRCPGSSWDRQGKGSSLARYHPAVENRSDSVSRRIVTSVGNTARYQVCRSACGVGLAKPGLAGDACK